MQIFVRNAQRSLPLSKKSAEKLAFVLLEKLKIKCEEIVIHFVGKKEISALHALFFDDPTPTDAISFPDGSDGRLGEVYICPAVAQEYALKHRLDAHEETSLYLVHSILHLLGYDDLTPRDKRRMRQQEKRCMRFLKQSDALLEPIQKFEM